MKRFRSVLSYCALALAACLSYSGFGYASDLGYTASYKLPSAFGIVGNYGAESAKFKAELAHMASQYQRTSTVTGSLTAESNGFRLSALTTSGTVSEVAKGKLGVTPGAVA